MLKPLFLLLGLFMTSSGIDLESRTLLDGKLELLMPKDWKQMPDDQVKIKYPGARPPKYVYSDRTGGISLAFNHTDSRVRPGELDQYFKVLKQSMETAYPDAKWEGSGFMDLNGRRAGYLKLLTEASNATIWNYLFFTDVDGKLFIGTFNCVESKLATWKPVAEEIVRSVKFH